MAVDVGISCEKCGLNVGRYFDKASEHRHPFLVPYISMLKTENVKFSFC